MLKVIVSASIANPGDRTERLAAVKREYVLAALPRSGDTIILRGSDAATERPEVVEDVIFDTEDGSVEVSLGQYQCPSECRGVDEWLDMDFVEVPIDSPYTEESN